MGSSAFIAIIAVLLVAVPAHAQDGAGSSTPAELTPAQLFDLADAARDRGDHALAERAYRALARNPDVELRTEARFRLAMMLTDQLGRHRDAAIELRRILDDKSGVARIRLELARVQAKLGNLAAAQREMRAAQAAGLPPEVDRLVRFFAGALHATKPLGASIEVAIAPDSNINRATRSETLSTIIGDFLLDDAAKERSGIGLSLRGQVYARAPLSRSTDLLLRASADANLYSRSRFDDIAVSVQGGPQVRAGADRISIAATIGWRWFGLDPYSISYGATGNWQHALGKRAQLRLDGSALREDNRVNDLLDANRFALGVSVERSLSARFGVGAQLSAFRDVARDPANSLTGGGITPYVFREFGKTTAVLQLGYTHLEADARTFIYTRRRLDDRYTASLSGTFRALRMGRFAPLARVRVERNRSTISLYDFRRIAAEFGLTAAF